MEISRGTEELWKKWMICFDSNASTTNLQETAKGQEKFWTFISCSAHSYAQFTSLPMRIYWAEHLYTPVLKYSGLQFILHAKLEVKWNKWATQKSPRSIYPIPLPNKDNLVSHLWPRCRYQKFNAYFFLSHHSQQGNDNMAPCSDPGLRVQQQQQSECGTPG